MEILPRSGSFRSLEMKFIIEYYENSGEPLTFYLKLLQERPYQYGKHLVPHDAGVHEYSTGLTRIVVARNLGNFLQAPNLSIDEGIDAVRNLLYRCWFDEEKCSSGIKALGFLLYSAFDHSINLFYVVNFLFFDDLP